ncbi:hypothetical protein TNCV_4600541 [Trichonephila clavipes]|nr:hypothetical protein TNCV_4600541 [Trichonephila clavipes]
MMALGCPMMALGCPVVALGCPVVALGCPVVALGCPVVALGCPVVALGCPVVALGCPVVAFGCPNIESTIFLFPLGSKTSPTLMVKKTDSWPAYHEFQLSTAEDLPCRGTMYVKSVEAQTSFRWCGVEVRRGECQLRCRPRHLTMVQNDEVSHQKLWSS